MKKFTLQDAQDVAKKLGIDFTTIGFTAEMLFEGLNIELEHGYVDAETNKNGGSWKSCWI